MHVAIVVQVIGTPVATYVCTCNCVTDMHMFIHTYVCKNRVRLTIFLASIRGFAGGLFMSVYLYTLNS